MKLITAVIKPLKLEDVCDALADLGVNGLTVMEVRGYGRQRGRTEHPRGSDYAVSFLPKLKIEVAVTDDMVDKTVDAIVSSAQTGRVGDGKIFVLDLGEVMRIRTRETGADALL
jgi:nitrogen regulatory protein P-II 2